MKKIFFLLLLIPYVRNISAPIIIQTETMTTSGPYAGLISSPFNGIALYANTDKVEKNALFDSIPGFYLVKMRAASNNSNSAGVSVYLAGIKIASFTFNGSIAVEKEVRIQLDGSSGIKKIELILENDNGSSDTYIDWISFTWDGLPRNTPVLPLQGAYFTDNYRNMFAEAGYNQTEINTKINDAWNQLFYGDDNNQRVYYPVSTDMAYIKDIGNGDIRSEGMSYGMMICLQMNKQNEFNRLWKWAKTFMQHQTGARKGYFAWQCGIDGSKKDNNPASDGEEYFVTSLFFAAHRWGNGTGIYNYNAEANYILRQMMNKEMNIQESVMNMFNASQKMVVFTPYASAASFTDPSYHLPAFYELWSLWADTLNMFWNDAADTSRVFFKRAANTTTGLMPDYANFNGTPTGSGHMEFRFDAWRCILNIAMDNAWFRNDNWQVTQANRILTFFYNEGVNNYGNQYNLDGTKLSSDYSTGLVGCNATGALACDQSKAWDFIDALWNQSTPTGQWRYYDGMLYMMSLLHVSGNFKIYKPSGSVNIEEKEKSFSHIKIYPTMVESILTIENAEGSSLKIFNLTGVTFFESIIRNNSDDLVLSQLNSGIYIVEIRNKKEVKTYKIVKR